METLISSKAKIASTVKFGIGPVVIEEGCEIADGAFIGGFCYLRPRTKIGVRTKIGPFVMFEGDCEIGADCSIHPMSVIGSGAVVEDGVFIGPCFVGGNDKRAIHKVVRTNLDWEKTSYVLKRGARIGSGVVVLPGVAIGENALIGAGSVVTKSIEPRAIAYGNPARIWGVVEDVELW